MSIVPSCGESCLVLEGFDFGGDVIFVIVGIVMLIFEVLEGL